MFRNDLSGRGVKNVVKGAAFSQATVDEKLNHTSGDGQQGRKADSECIENLKLT